MRGRSVGVLALAALGFGCARDDGSVIEATGTVEVVEVDVAPTTPSRVTRVLVEEGAAVRVGDTLATLTQPTLPQEIEQREARVAQAAAGLRELERGTRAAEIARAEAELRAAEAEAARTARDLERASGLAASQVISQQQLDAARAAAHAAAGRRDVARASLRLAREGARPERIQAARAELAGARAGVAAARATQSDLVLVAPVAGTVMGRHAEPGEILAAGQPALTIGEMQRPWVRVYVAERVLPELRIGGAATAALDAFPGRPFRGRVVAINDKAEYTPRVALTEEERADLVFGVKVELEDSTGMLKPGLPVTVRFARDAGREKGEAVAEDGRR